MDPSALAGVTLTRFPSDDPGAMTAWRAIDLLAGEGELDRVGASRVGQRIPTPRGVCPQVYKFVTTLASVRWNEPGAMSVAIRPLLPALIGTAASPEVAAARSAYLFDRALRDYLPRVVAGAVRFLEARGMDCAAIRAAAEVFAADPSEETLAALRGAGAEAYARCNAEGFAALKALQAKYFDARGDGKGNTPEERKSSIESFHTERKGEGPCRDAEERAGVANLIQYGCGQLMEVMKDPKPGDDVFPEWASYVAAEIAAIGGDEVRELASSHAAHAITIDRAASPSAGDRAVPREAPSVPASPAEFLPTGVAAFDALMGGGLRTGRVALILGPPGCGRVTLTYLIAASAAAAVGSDAVRVLVDEIVGDDTAEGFLGDFARDLGAAPPLEPHPLKSMGALLKEVSSGALRLCVLDVSISLLRTEVTPSLDRLKEACAASGTSLLLSCAWGRGSGDVADRVGTVVMPRGVVEGEGIRVHVQRDARDPGRSGVVPVPAVRFSDQSRDVADVVPEPVVRVSSGAQDLDDLLRGGFVEGTTILITGPDGTGRVTLAHYIAARMAHARGNRAVRVYADPADADGIGVSAALLRGFADQLGASAPLEPERMPTAELLAEQLADPDLAMVLVDLSAARMHPSLWPILSGGGLPQGEGEPTAPTPRARRIQLVTGRPSGVEGGYAHYVDAVLGTAQVTKGPDAAVCVRVPKNRHARNTFGFVQIGATNSTR